MKFTGSHHSRPGPRHNKGAAHVCVEHDALLLGNLFITQRVFLCAVVFSSSIFHDVKVNHQPRRRGSGARHSSVYLCRVLMRGAGGGVAKFWSRVTDAVLRPAGSPLDNGQPRLFLIWCFFSCLPSGWCRLARTWYLWQWDKLLVGSGSRSADRLNCLTVFDSA